ncbi:MAG: hypothetical protein J6A01_03635 [Proteobacteria bacterium]|nr:hypothetical protein [Pseudomonadota bacterium]
MGTLISEKYKAWEQECEKRFKQLKANEEELNRIFIDIYGMSTELTPAIKDKDVTVCRANIVREIKSLLSYAVGCMFGRYSLDKAGLCFAGGNFYDYFAPAPDSKNTFKNRYYLKTLVSSQNANASLNMDSHFGVSADNIIPIADGEYFDEDILTRIVEFVQIVYGADTLEANLNYIAETLGGKGTSREIIRSYFLNDFYADHIKMYQKRPIYWMFSSGKKNGFKCLMYVHRYGSDTLAQIGDYIQYLQKQYQCAISDLNVRLASSFGDEDENIAKQLAKLSEQSEELLIYASKIQSLKERKITIDLDDGIKLNYLKLSDVLADVNF